jgi:hypothetical protein
MLFTVVYFKKETVEKGGKVNNSLNSLPINWQAIFIFAILLIYFSQANVEVGVSW